MFAKQRLYLNADKTRLVGDGDKDAAFLYAALGDEIPQSAADKFGLVDGDIAPKGRKHVESLLGSSVLPAVVALTAAVSVQLGAIVARAHKDSGLTADAWNTLAEAEREALLAAAIDVMKVEAATPKLPKATKAARPPATGKKPAKAAAPVKEQKPAEDKENKGGGDKGAGQQSGNDQGGAQANENGQP